MSEHIEIELEQHARLVLPSPLASRLGLRPGTRLVAEQAAANVALRVQSGEPKLVEKQGVLVLEPEVTTDLEELVRNEREQHIRELIQRVGQ